MKIACALETILKAQRDLYLSFCPASTKIFLSLLSFSVLLSFLLFSSLFFSFLYFSFSSLFFSFIFFVRFFLAPFFVLSLFIHSSFFNRSCFNRSCFLFTSLQLFPLYPYINSYPMRHSLVNKKANDIYQLLIILYQI